MTQDRGFNKLKGKTIKAVDATCINYVRLLCTDGTVFEIHAGNVPLGHAGSIPTIELTRSPEKLENFRRRKKEKVAWPYPAAEAGTAADSVDYLPD